MEGFPSLPLGFVGVEVASLTILPFHWLVVCACLCWFPGGVSSLFNKAIRFEVMAINTFVAHRLSGVPVLVDWRRKGLEGSLCGSQMQIVDSIGYSSVCFLSTTATTTEQQQNNKNNDDDDNNDNNDNSNDNNNDNDNNN